jgi:hypothetical protein
MGALKQGQQQTIKSAAPFLCAHAGPQSVTAFADKNSNKSASQTWKKVVSL